MPLQMGYSPGFISREWIETGWLQLHCCPSSILPALLVGSGLKLITKLRQRESSNNSPGFISREWIETGNAGTVARLHKFSRLY